jgi:large subunit ribosomal protein L13
MVILSKCGASQSLRPTARTLLTVTRPTPKKLLTASGHTRNFRALSAPMKTFSAKANEVPRKWWIIDANNQILGQVAVKAANLLRGKEKAIYTTHVDTGDFVVVINAEKVRLSGKKEEQKSYMSFSGFVGGHKTENARARRARHPELLVERAIRGMIPHNKLGRAVYRKLKVYRGDLHPHAAQQPAQVTLAS